MQNVENPNIKYFPQIDGLRAISILMVMFLHAHFQLGINGKIGVDIFFGLSGFLITRLLLEEYSAFQNISLKNFYIRRALRLFPALLLMLLAVFIYTLLFQEQPVKGKIMKEVLSSLLYLNNISWIWGWGENSIILGHTWSLAVEEQFYFFWPLILYLFFKSNKYRWLTWFVIATLVISISYVLLNDDPVFLSVFHSPILVGCYFALFNSQVIKKYFLSNTLTFILLICIIFYGFMPYKANFNSNISSLFISIIIGLIIISLIENHNSAISRFLSFSPICFIGKISYALYLWHVPVFRWFSWYSSFPPVISFMLKFIVTFSIAIFSWFIIEKRFILYSKKYRRV